MANALGEGLFLILSAIQLEKPFGEGEKEMEIPAEMREQQNKMCHCIRIHLLDLLRDRSGGRLTLKTSSNLKLSFKYF